MSELTTQESSDDLDPISESPSRTLDEDRESSSDGNDETLGDDDIIDAIDEVTDDPKADHAAATIESKNNDNNSSLDTANANLDFRNVTDIENNIPVSLFFKLKAIFFQKQRLGPFVNYVSTLGYLVGWLNANQC